MTVYDKDYVEKLFKQVLSLQDENKLLKRKISDLENDVAQLEKHLDYLLPELTDTQH